MDFPYFLCFKPRDGMIKLLAEGLGDGVRIYPDCSLESCDITVKELDSTEKKYFFRCYMRNNHR